MRIDINRASLLLSPDIEQSKNGGGSLKKILNLSFPRIKVEFVPLLTNILPLKCFVENTEAKWQGE